MPSYKVTAPDGKTLRISGDRPPTEAELQQIFESRQNKAPASPSNFYGAEGGMLAGLPKSGGVPGTAAVMGTAADVGLESGGAAAGQAMGAPFAPATAGLSIPVGGFIGGFLGNTAAQLRQGGDYNLGQAVGAGAAGAIPGASLAKAPVQAVLKAGAKSAAANVGATALEDVIQGQAPNPARYAAAGVGGFVAPAIGRFMDTGERATQTAIKTAQNSARDAVTAELRAAGYKIPAKELNPTKVNKAIESLVGSPQTAFEANVRNQEVTQQLARKALGLPDSAPVTEEILQGVRDEANKAYAAVANLSPKAAKDLDALKAARRDATQYWKAFERSAHPDDRNMAEALDKRADFLENKLDYRALFHNQPDLIPALKEARKQIAKTHEVERSLKGFDVDASRLSKNVDYLTEDLSTIGKMGKFFPKFVRANASEPRQGPLSLTAELMRTPARKLYMSDIYTKFMGQPYYGMNAADFPAEMGRFATMNASRKPEPRPPSVPLFMTPAPQF